ncbi:3'-5' exonuclease [Prosthecomicrobium hirschii]|uniref:3'-5' exonuclease n=1 Tax=Prosthecodimorpha hirschii TaxID=665126 RepID=UPI00221E75A7|nr:3'-5' exonuclease [Prosthecomicrobium hirschii]MCW1844191.1 3'-5' exonuclease [Prosthecomicrobium hirschii]
MSVIVIDCETTGLPDWKRPLWDPAQPRITQISAVQWDPKTRRVLNCFSALTKRDGWTSNAGARAVHGIPDRRNDLFGLGPIWWLGLLIGNGDQPGMLMTSRKIASYGAQFDKAMIEIELHARTRSAGQDPSTNALPAPWRSPSVNWICLLTEAAAAANGGKSMKLPEAHEALVGRPYEQKHDALDDVQAASRILWALVDRKKLEV